MTRQINYAEHVKGPALFARQARMAAEADQADRELAELRAAHAVASALNGMGRTDTATPESLEAKLDEDR